MCVVDDILRSIHTLIPKESYLHDIHFRQLLKTFGGTCPNLPYLSNYISELYAIIACLVSTPFHYHLLIVTDSKSAQQSILKFQLHSNERRRLRMQARPLLQMIYDLMKARTSCGGSVKFQHIKAHTDMSDIYSVGNRCADFAANRYRSKHFQSNFRFPDLMKGEKYVAFKCSSIDNDAKIIVDDIRRTAKQHMNQMKMQQWKQSSSQKLFAHEASAALASWALNENHSSPMMRRFLPFLLTNTIHKTIIPPAFMKMDKWKWLKRNCNCPDFEHSNAIPHIIHKCKHHQQCRLKTCQQIMTYLQHHFPSSTQWFTNIVQQLQSQTSSSLSSATMAMKLHDLIRLMFDDSDIRFCIGVFTRAEACKALRNIGYHEENESIYNETLMQFMSNIRLILLEHILGCCINTC